MYQDDDEKEEGNGGSFRLRDTGPLILRTADTDVINVNVTMYFVGASPTTVLINSGRDGNFREDKLSLSFSSCTFQGCESVPFEIIAPESRLNEFLSELR